MTAINITAIDYEGNELSSFDNTAIAEKCCCIGVFSSLEECAKECKLEPFGIMAACNVSGQYLLLTTGLFHRVPDFEPVVI